MLSGRSPSTSHNAVAATDNNKAGEACDDHSEPKHHRPAQSLLPRHSTAILSRVTGRRWAASRRAARAIGSCNTGASTMAARSVSEEIRVRALPAPAGVV